MIRIAGCFLALVFLLAAIQAGPAKSLSRFCVPPAETDCSTDGDSEKFGDSQHGASTDAIDDKSHLRFDIGADRVTPRTHRRLWDSMVVSSFFVLRC